MKRSIWDPARNSWERLRIGMTRHCRACILMVVLVALILEGFCWLLCQPNMAALADQVQVGMTREPNTRRAFVFGALPNSCE